ncbi:two-component system response regulator RstA [Laribacter hongkongensis]|uniref:DNA-binding response regulator in two-component regulatory system with RstB n=2 Tax=Laribacter hongkongensis TaxID=168471 RepID=C1DAL7_LARHH|nr:two-component system response regulator RstA [Laribacter hongkongensis]ACO73198.1 DNA-binding response regulator in two-component regulatory system with RstB [Laribacter hongkongensis HLHK9]ASJ23035.1 DNA-binding response regulator in two-component regulatory system with RstB [Laribacter hongkongensis]MBE5529158.1 two-component system response regulator RstA [Laribacter hongkongensis]MCG8993480.1 two-component system response regulator RstA [Laribacter hongkongensis]MCG8996264.1 two-compone
MNPRITFVEDDAELAELISDYLRSYGLDVTVIDRGDTAFDAILAAPPDLVLLDIMLPGKDGLTLCRELRGQYQGPIVMLTSLNSDMNQILGFELGANDYVLKTTPPSVLLARLRAHLRQAASSPDTPVVAAPTPKGARILDFGSLQIDHMNRTVRLCGETIALSTGDFDLLWELASHAGEVLTREDLLYKLRGVHYDGLDRSVDVAISRLRKKLDDDTADPKKIKTIRHKGYLFANDVWH